VLVWFPAPAIGAPGARDAAEPGGVHGRRGDPGDRSTKVLRYAGSRTPSEDPSPQGARRSAAATDWQVVKGGGARGRGHHVPGVGKPTRRGGFADPGEYLPARGARHVVRP